MLRGARADERLKDGKVDVGGQDGIEDILGARLELDAAFEDVLLTVFIGEADLIEAGQRQKGQHGRKLGEGVDESREEDGDFVHRAVQKLLHAKLRD